MSLIRSSLLLRTRVLTIALSLFTLLSPAVFAQFDSGTVLGTIRDQSGAVVANVTVTLENVSTGVTSNTTTSTEGDFTFVNVRLGRYRIKTQAAGFQAAQTDGFEVTTAARQRVDVSLKVGQVSESVMVTGAAVLLETDNSTRGQVINPRQIVELPLNGRAYADLALLVPGVRKSLLQNQTETSRDASFNVNGMRSSQNNFMLDGVDNNAYGTSNQGFSNQVVQASPDALQEFKVETNNFSAEYGRAAGAIVNASIKSGTNQIHGSAWEFIRNTKLNAVGFFQPTGGVKPVFQQNQFGASVGGAIKKDKIFLFGDFESFQRVSRTLTYATVPTMDMRAGKFGIPVKNPLTGAVYADGNVPSTDMISFAKTVLSQLPAPTTGDIANNYQSLPRTTIADNKGDIRLDWYLNQKLSTFTRFSYRDADIFSPPPIPGPSGGNANGYIYARNWQLAPGATWSINSNSVLEVRLGVGFTNGGKSPVNLDVDNSVYGIPGLPTNKDFAGGLYTLNMNGGLSQLGRQSSNPQYQNPLVIDPKVNYSRFVGRHTLKTGFEYQMINTEIQDFHPKYGVDNYSGVFSSPTGTASGSLQQQVYAVADLMFGLRSHYELNNYAVDYYRQRMYFYYLQDDFKVNSKLTLNLGVRYEYGTPQWEANNKLANLDPVSQTMIQSKGGDIYGRSLIHPDRNDWAPRVGMAYRLGNKTAIRAAYGVSYIHFNRLGGENLLGYNGPNIIDATIDQVPSQGLCSSTSADPTTCFRPTYMGFPDNFASPDKFRTITTQVRYIPANLRDGYIQNWHFTIQRELTKDLTLDVAYVGSKGTRIMILGDYNQANPNQPGQNIALQSRRPLANFTTIEIAFDGGFSTYHALQTKLEKRFGGGLYALNSFSWSKAIDNASGHLEANNGDNSRANYRDLTHEKGLSSYDQPFNNTLSLIYQLPFGKGRRFALPNAVTNWALGGWEVSLMNTLTSGLPINLTYSPSSQYSVSGLPSYRVNVTGNPVLAEGSRTGNPSTSSQYIQYLNASAVAQPTDPSHPFGNAGRNIARGYPLYQVDCGIHKDFPVLRESWKLQFRGEAFNLTNQTNFMAPSSNLGSTYGRITSTFPARQLQFGLKFLF